MKTFAGLRDSLALWYDRLYSEPNRVRFELWVVRLSVAGFLLHLALIFLANSLTNPALLIAAAGKNYLSSIATPFSFILFYEVLLLIAAIPQSAAESVEKQFEIVSLVFVRGFFKHIAEIDGLGQLRQSSADVGPLFIDIGAGLTMFLLVTVFQQISLRARRVEVASEHSHEYQAFVARKKVIALVLTVCLLGLTVFTLVDLGQNAYDVIYQGATNHVQAFFYTDVFSVMIFTDVLILILSLVVSDRYELVFRKAAFVISTILIRFSLTADRPFGAGLAVVGIGLGIVTMLIYSYSISLQARYRD